MYRAMGSIAFVAASRSSWLVAADPKHPDATRRFFTPVKTNLNTEVIHGLAYQCGPQVPGAFFWEEGAITTSADEALTGLTRSPAKAEAKDWLTEMLGNGPLTAAEIWEKAKADGLCERTLKSAKKELRVITEKSGGKGTPWIWRLPEEKG